MFSGIVDELGRVARNAIESEGRLEVSASAVVGDLGVGDSIAVNGCCLTVVAVSAAGFAADVMPETGRRTTLGALAAGDAVNLEAALVYGERIGGHMVSGHVDTVGTIADRRGEGNAVWVTVAAGDEVGRYLVERGCVAVDGISLTVVQAGAGRFSVSLIPHTIGATTAGSWVPGVRVNLEADLLARYVQRSLAAPPAGAHSP